jgi:hypothetical protein
VQREADGSVARTETPPEVAAVRTLSLPPDILENIEALLYKRARFFDRFIENNLELLGKLDTAGNTGDKVDQALLGVQALSKLAPLTRDGSLRKQVRELLPMDQVEAFDRALGEYWDAIVSQEKQKDPKKSRFEIMAAERMASLTREATAAFERLEKSGVLLFNYFFKKIELSDEQTAAIRTLLDEFVEETKGAPTKQQEQKVFFAVMSKLDTTQQTALIKHFKAQQGPPKPAKDAKPVKPMEKTE